MAREGVVRGRWGGGVSQTGQKNGKNQFRARECQQESGRQKKATSQEGRREGSDVETM